MRICIVSNMYRKALTWIPYFDTDSDSTISRYRKFPPWPDIDLTLQVMHTLYVLLAVLFKVPNEKL